MKKCLRSVFIKKNLLSDTENQRILEDLAQYNSMKRSSFLWQIQDRKFFLENGTEQSHHLHLKQTFGCNDYFANSAKMEAKGIVRSQEELRNLYLSDVKDELKALKKFLKKKRNYRKKLLTIKESFIAHQKDPKKPLKGSANIQYEKDGSVTLRFFQKEWHYETLYLFEHQWLDRKIKNLKNQIARMEQKQERLEIKQKQLKDGKKSKVHFGGKKLCKRRDLPERHRALEKRRDQRMMISGRKDSKDGNFVFHYDPFAKTLTYRSMTDWNGKKICFPDVIFPYGQAWIEEYLRERKGAVAWEIIDRGNAWQICCVISIEAEDMNTYYGDGTVGIDINYDRIAVTETDGNGNLLSHKVFPFCTEGKRSGQIKQILSETLEQAFTYAVQKKKTITAESIKSIQRKKFYDKHRKKHRHISMFASAYIRELLTSKSLKYHLSVRFVDPAYTSKAGKMKYMRRFGLSVHESAALCIARRGLGFKETLPPYLRSYVTDAKQRASISSQWGSLTKLIKKVTTQVLYHYYQPDRETYFLYRKWLLESRALTDIERAFYFLVINRCSFSGIQMANPKTNMQERWIPETLIKRIEKIHTMQNQIEIRNENAMKLIEELYWNKDCCIFIDPPYISKGDCLYPVKFHLHKELATLITDLLREFPGCADILITYDDQEILHELYDQEHIDLQVIGRRYSCTNL